MSLHRCGIVATVAAAVAAAVIYVAAVAASEIKVVDISLPIGSYGRYRNNSGRYSGSYNGSYGRYAACIVSASRVVPGACRPPVPKVKAVCGKEWPDL